MLEFFQDLQNHTFLQYAALTGALSSISCGIVGAFVVVKRITYIAGGIAHTVLGGMGAAVYIQKTGVWPGCEPLYGAIVAAIMAALIIGIVSVRAKEREDTIIGALWAAGMAVGILFISRTPGYSADLMSYLFGNILMVSSKDIWLMVGLDIVVVGLTFALFHQFLSVCFDSEFAELRGLNANLLYIILLCLTALTVVVLISIVGIVLVIALLTLPAAIAGFFCRNLKTIIIVSSGLCALFTTSGLMVSYGPDLPVGATTIALAAATYLALSIIKALGQKVGSLNQR